MENSSKTVICFVANFKYLFKNFPRIYEELRNKGNYKGEILIITSLLAPTFLIKEIRNKYGVKIMRFPKIKFDKSTEKSLQDLNSKPNRHIEKNFQWYKLYLFNPKIKKWRYVFYFDINMSIHHDINPILELRPKNKVLARADGFPNYEWKLNSQFDKSHPKYLELNSHFDLERTDYFQTGLIYFDTNIVNNRTFDEILFLIKKYPITVTNEQGILNIYFLFIEKKYLELETFVNGKLSYFYWKIKDTDVIITKATTEKNK